MKKLCCLVLTVIICLGLTACENEDVTVSVSSNPQLYSNITTSANQSAEPATSSKNPDALSSDSLISSRFETSSTSSHTTSALTASAAGNATVKCKHNYKIKSQTATCEKDGVTTKVCTLCGNSYQEPQKATGHNFSETYKAPTCTSAGYKTLTCKKCNITKKQEIPATGHSFSGIRCTKCGLADVTAARNLAVKWFKSADHATVNNGEVYLLPSDNRYDFSAIDGGNLFFSYSDGKEVIYLSVYGFEKNACYLEYKCYKNGQLKIIERQFPMDSFHSKYTNYFNDMNGDTELSEQIRGKIDAFMLKFENELLKPKINITLKDIGFTEYN